MIHKSYKFKLLPNQFQKELINKHFGCCRFVYNYYLNKKVQMHKDDKINLTFCMMSKDLTNLKKEKSWLNEVSRECLNNSLKNLEIAFSKFFASIKNKKLKRGFPRFKNKYNKQTFRVFRQVKIINNKLYLPKFKDGIKLINSHIIKGKLKYCSIFTDKCGNYYVGIQTEQENLSSIKNNNKIGIDCNVKQIVCANGKNFQKFDNPLPEHKHKKRLKLLAQSVSRKQKGSKSRAKAQLKLNKFKQYCKNVREDFLHKTSRKIIDENQVIIVESLIIKELSKKDAKNKLAKKARNSLFNDCSFGSFLVKLEYKSKWYSREFIKIDRFYPSSKLCSICGHKNEDLKDQKNWQCINCQIHHNRDENAAINILNEGLRIRTAGTAGLADRPSISPILDRRLVGSEILLENSSNHKYDDFKMDSSDE